MKRRDFIKMISAAVLSAPFVLQAKFKPIESVDMSINQQSGMDKETVERRKENEDMHDFVRVVGKGELMVIMPREAIDETMFTRIFIGTILDKYSIHAGYLSMAQNDRNFIADLHDIYPQRLHVSQLHSLAKDELELVIAQWMNDFNIKILVINLTQDAYELVSENAANNRIEIIPLLKEITTRHNIQVIVTCERDSVLNKRLENQRNFYDLERFRLVDYYSETVSLMDEGEEFDVIILDKMSHMASFSRKKA